MPSGTGGEDPVERRIKFTVRGVVVGHYFPAPRSWRDWFRWESFKDRIRCTRLPGSAAIIVDLNQNDVRRARRTVPRRADRKLTDFVDGQGRPAPFKVSKQRFWVGEKKEQVLKRFPQGSAVKITFGYLSPVDQLCSGSRNPLRFFDIVPDEQTALGP